MYQRKKRVGLVGLESHADLNDNPTIDSYFERMGGGWTRNLQVIYQHVMRCIVLIFIYMFRHILMCQNYKKFK
jgi:hypothetical protein